MLPPVAKLSSGQAMYHFISGYTAKVAGTECGITEPTPNFSACFGAPFMTLHPTRYADLLQQKMDEHGSRAWLVNTGWSGGSYGTGERVSIQTTRACIDSIIDGSADNATCGTDHIFGFNVPLELRIKIKYIVVKGFLCSSFTQHLNQVLIIRIILKISIYIIGFG